MDEFELCMNMNLLTQKSSELDFLTNRSGNPLIVGLNPAHVNPYLIFPAGFIVRFLQDFMPN